MAAFGLISLDAEKVGPIVVLAVVGVGGYLLIKYVNAQQANSANAAADTANTYGTQDQQDLAQLMLLQDALGDSTAGEGNSGSTQATYSGAGTETTGSGLPPVTSPNTAPAPVGSSSTTALTNPTASAIA